MFRSILRRFVNKVCLREIYRLFKIDHGSDDGVIAANWKFEVETIH